MDIVDSELVFKLGKLTKLEVLEKEVVEYKKSISEVLTFFSVIDQFEQKESKIDLDGDCISRVEREDRPVNSDDWRTVLDNAPSSQGSAFVVPKVFD